MKDSVTNQTGAGAFKPCLDKAALAITRVQIAEYDQAMPLAPMAPYSGKLLRQFCIGIPTKDYWIKLSTMANGGFYLDQLQISAYLSAFGNQFGITAPYFTIRLL